MLDIAGRRKYGILRRGKKERREQQEDQQP
jgi:hypothetical protein